MINWIKSYLLSKKEKLQVVEYLQKAVKGRFDLYTCYLVADSYPEPVQLWYQRQVHRYAKQHGVCQDQPFAKWKGWSGKEDGLAYRNNTTPDTERLIFLKELHDQFY